MFDSENLVYEEDESIKFGVVGYDLDQMDKTDRTHVTIFGTLGYGAREKIKSFVITGDDHLKTHPVNIGRVDIGNTTSISYLIEVEIRFQNGEIEFVKRAISIWKPSVKYSAHFYSDGSMLHFFSPTNESFEVTIVYNYGYAVASNTTVYTDVKGERVFHIGKYEGLISVEAYIKDRWGHVNANEPTADNGGGPLPLYHPFIDEPEPVKDIFFRILLIIIIVLVALTCVLIIFGRVKK